MIDQYEAAIKETFKYLDEAIAEQDKLNPLIRLQSLGIDKQYVIESQMKKKGFIVKAEVYPSQCEVRVYPKADNLPIHIWRELYDKSRIK